MISKLKSRFSKLRSAGLRSPLKAKPLRLPGQSLDEEIDRTLNGKAEGYLFMAGGTVLLAAFEWIHVLTHAPPMPLPLTAVALCVCAYVGFRLLELRNKIRNLKHGRDGERIFGQFLDDHLRPLGLFVLHDLRGGNWNIDHVVLGEHGIYTVETKTWSKPRRGPPFVRYDGESLTVTGWKPERDPIAQAKGQAAWLRETLSRSLGLNVPVQPIVAFPGWFVESTKDPTRHEVWTLSGKAVPSFISNSGQRIEPQTAKTIGYFLRQMVRAG